jgi:hypothetical protein
MRDPGGTIYGICHASLIVVLALFLDFIVAIVSQVPPPESTPASPRQFLR